MPAPAARLDAYSIRLFIAAAEQGSIARAAEREHIAASALSRRIADLEHAFGTPLLVRSPRGITLTHAGRLVFERGLRMERELDHLVQEVRSLGGQVAGTVRLHANASAIVGFLPERLREFSRVCPDVRIELHEQSSREVVRACLDDAADLGVAVAMEVSRGLDSWHFAFDPLLVLLPAGHPLAANRRIAFREALAAGLVGLQEGGSLSQLVRERAQALQVPLQFSVTVNSFDAACRMVEAGLGVAVMPRSGASAYAGSEKFERRELAEDWTQRELRLYALQKTPRPAAVEALIGALRR
ncbi:MAG TPA: LysR family transcriptional regulator [Ramlibacter sp.]|nr:LysR family transcriptional regulator [Ramlibacter sp.]